MFNLKSTSARAVIISIDRPVAARLIPSLAGSQRHRGEPEHPRTKRRLAVPFLSDSESDDDTSGLFLPPYKRKRLTNATPAYLQLNINQSSLDIPDEETPNRVEVAPISNQRGLAALSGEPGRSEIASTIRLSPYSGTAHNMPSEEVEIGTIYGDHIDTSSTFQNVASSDSTLSSATLSYATFTLDSHQSPASVPLVTTESANLHAPDRFYNNPSPVWEWLQDTDCGIEIENFADLIGEDSYLESVDYDVKDNVLLNGVGGVLHIGFDQEG